MFLGRSAWIRPIKILFQRCLQQELRRSLISQKMLLPFTCREAGQHPLGRRVSPLFAWGEMGWLLLLKKFGLLLLGCAYVLAVVFF
jgi:hypothetical protein